MGKIYSTLTRPIRTFNIANRAEKIISKEKPIPAPQYVSTEKQRKLMDEINPTFMKDHYQKNERLDEQLKRVFVSSTDLPETLQTKESRPLPQNKCSQDEFIFDFYEPMVIPEGKCSLKQALTFISQHRNDPTIYSSENIAATYKMDKKVVDDILKHFKLYKSSTPDYPEYIPVEPIQIMIDVGTKHREMKRSQKKKEE